MWGTSQRLSERDIMLLMERLLSWRGSGKLQVSGRCQRGGDVMSGLLTGPSICLTGPA